MYENGRGVEQSYEKAAKWYQKAADQGDAVAQYNLGTMYKNGLGVEQSYKKAAKWYRKAADQGLAAAKKKLSELGATK
ncbi:tetratricopeptide repeat protein [uncultured Dialister sp.]|uniref:tetratricopeptide repeat protein n=1 Tax=uncultured Dialister sp. TaxID=278064 RepID=UPI002590C8A2|nr:tetratricopeptide repeat protein [uncultured Dialister sp.]